MKVSVRFLGSLALIVLLAGVLSECGSGGNGTQPPPPPPGGAIALTFQSSQRFQTFEAWRATATGPYFPTSSGSQLISSDVLRQILDDLASDLGINGLRFELHSQQLAQATASGFDPCSGNWSTYNFSQTFTVENGTLLIDPAKQMNSVVLALKSRVEARGEPFSAYFSPIFDSPDVPQCWHNNAQLYAAYAQAAVNWSKTNFNGYVPNYWAIFNEPSFSSFTINEFANDIVATGNAFQASGFSTRIQTLETASPQSANLQSVLNVSGTTPFIRLISYHGYDYSAGSVPSFSERNNIRDIAGQLGDRTGMTEICCQSGWNGGYIQALGWARDIYWNLTEGNVSVWEPLAVMGPCGSIGCPGGGQAPIVIDADLSRYFKFASYYGLRQYAHYIRPGFIRVGVSCPACTSNSSVGQNIKPVAFQSPSGGVVVVVVNDQSGPQDITLSGLPAGTYNITGVDPGNPTSKTYPSQVIAAGQSLVITFPAQAILTFVKQ